jgi:tRNA threonylcarbamoyl adenosine modification protein YeaZ
MEVPPPSLRLSLDTSSPIVSVAVGRAGELLAATTLEQRRSSGELIDAVDGCLRRAGVAVEELEELVVLRGPGSFTGLRIGLATAMGLHHALGLRVAAPSTFEVLARALPADGHILALVHALRDDWFAQLFAGVPPSPRSEPRRIARAELPMLDADRAVGFELERLGADREALAAVEPPPLAEVAARLPAAELTWDPEALRHPLYLAPPPTARPQRPKSVLGEGP